MKLTKEKVNNYAKMFMITFIWVFIILFSIISFKQLSILNDSFSSGSKTDYNYQVYRNSTELAMQGVKYNIVNTIDNYIDSVAPGSMLNGIKLFELCDTYNVDVRFAMAQAQIESHFGTKGLASKTNTVWNVHTFDGDTFEDVKRKNCIYKHPDESIEPYLILLVNSYLINGKTEEDMFVNFVNYDNSRYASNPDYESMLLNTYNQINENTNLKKLLNEYKRYKMILS